MKKIFLIIIGLAIVVFSIAQKNECLTDFNYLVNKIKNNYPGYNDKVTDSTFSDLQRLEKELRKKIMIYPDSCHLYLYQYVSWFKDFHLKVNINWSHEKYSSTETKKRNKRFIEINPDTIQISQNSPEGVWVGYRGKVAIVKQNKENTFYGISIDYRNYEPNQVVFELSGQDANNYDMISFPYYRNYDSVNGKASIYLNNKIIELHEDTRLVRKTENEISDKALLLSYPAKFPNGSNTFYVATYLSDSTYYLRIPGFSSDQAENLVKNHWQDIVSRPNLIIDIRNNGGGQDDYYQSLAKLVYTDPYESKGIEWYATKENIKMYEDVLKNNEITGGEEEIQWTKILLAEMKKDVGGFVIHPMMGKDKEIVRDTIYPLPKRVGIIINERNGSSAESFIMSSKQSKKVILFGNKNTAGVLDYSNTIKVDFPSGAYKLTYPMTRSRRLPENPIDNVGIAPDILIPFPSTKQLYDRLDDWVYYVQNYLELLNE